jgi:hypothetical protein
VETTTLDWRLGDEVIEHVQEHALGNLSAARRVRSSNLFLDRHVYGRGETIGPPRQKIVAEQPTALVFADDEPQANWAHPCRYLLYDAENGDHRREVHAQFPPVLGESGRAELEPLHVPVTFTQEPTLRPFPIWFRCPVIWPRGDRYAVLFAGMSNKRHLNDMEFLYRTLVDVYGFRPDHIYALSYDGTLNTQDGVQATWPGDGTAYRIQITGSGTRASLEGAVDELKTRLQAQDLLVVHTNNHGGYDYTPGTANLCTYPNWDGYYTNDFAAKIGELPTFRHLLVMMEQCHAGGFNAPIIAHSTASATSVASAATEPNNSYVSADGNWDPFARDWISAQAGHDSFGHPLAFNPDTNGDGRIEATEAYNYANSVKDPRDTPNFDESSLQGGAIYLGREYVIWGWWCRILLELLEPWGRRLPVPEYYERLNSLQNEIAEVTEEIDREGEKLRAAFQPRLAAIVEKAFR